MKPLSERMATSHAYSYAPDVRALEADLADANARAMELTARCDRLRYEADVWRDKQAQASKGRAEAIAVLHLVYEMREHALRRERDARVIPPVALEATSGGARGMDAADAFVTMTCDELFGPASDEDLEDLARRRATERAEDPCADCEATPCDCDADPLAALRQLAQERKDAEATRAAAIAERDARIAALTRERDVYRDDLNACRLDLANACDAWRRERARADRDLSVAERDRDEAIARAERAEARIAKVRECCAGHANNGYAMGTVHHILACVVLAILDGKESA